MSDISHTTSYPVASSPILKWAGGKGRILPLLLPMLPKDVAERRHIEPFTGGGAMFFARRPEGAYLSDINSHLIKTYLAVRDHVENVIDGLQCLAKLHSKDQYYVARDRYNSSVLSNSERAALFIYLNRTCFNGLYRVSKRGHFNVPIGSYKNPRILDSENLRRASHVLRAATLCCHDFVAACSTATRSDFVYLDPPYDPISDTANFTSYTEGSFSRHDHMRLRDCFIGMSKRGVACMLSNSDTPFVRELYAGFNIRQISAPRSVSCKGSKRNSVNELVITNYSS